MLLHCISFDVVYFTSDLSTHCHTGFKEPGRTMLDCTFYLSLQVMVDSEVSGVAFSRHPLTPLSSNTVLVEAVYGLGEGLVSGELEADRYEVC